MACMKEADRITCVLFDNPAGRQKASPSPGLEVMLPDCELKYILENVLNQLP
jgi:hypothetical protein